MEEGRRWYFRKWGRLHRGQGELGMLRSCRSWVQQAQVQRAGEWVGEGERQERTGDQKGMAGSPTGARW